MKCEEIELDLFLAGRLSTAGEKRIARHIEECEKCRDRLRIMIELDGSGQQRTDRLPHGPIFNHRTFLAAAAGIFLAIFSGAVINYAFGPRGEEDIARLASESPYPMILLETRKENENPLGRGLLLYKEGRFAEAAEELVKQEGSHEALFFSAISLYMLDRPTEALEKLRRVARLSGTWKDPAEWFQAQALLKLERKEDAIKLLTGIASGEHQYSEQARAVLKELEK